MATVSKDGFGELRKYLPLDANNQSALRQDKAAKLRAEARRGYRSCISFVDHEIGRLLRALSSDQEKSSIVALISDHG